VGNAKAIECLGTFVHDLQVRVGAHHDGDDWFHVLPAFATLDLVSCVLCLVSRGRLSDRPEASASSKALIRPFSKREVVPHDPIAASYCDSVTKRRRRDNSSCVSTSDSEPFALPRNCRNSPIVF